MKNSSNQNMDKVFEQLVKIKKVDPSANLYVKTLNRLHRQSIVPFFWARVVACLFIALISAEFFMVSKYKKHNNADISALIYRTNHFSYND